MARQSMAKNATLSPVPDDRRCLRNDGRGWRCRSEAQPGLRYCSYHIRLDDRCRSLYRSKTKAARTATNSKVTRVATDGNGSEDPDAGDLMLRRKKAKEKRENVVKASSPRVMAALRALAKKNRGFILFCNLHLNFVFCIWTLRKLEYLVHYELQLIQLK